MAPMFCMSIPTSYYPRQLRRTIDMPVTSTFNPNNALCFTEEDGTLSFVVGGISTTITQKYSEIRNREP